MHHDYTPWKVLQCIPYLSVCMVHCYWHSNGKTVHDVLKQEYVFDHIFSHLGVNTPGSVNHPIVMTEPVCNPNYCRQCKYCKIIDVIYNKHNSKQSFGLVIQHYWSLGVENCFGDEPHKDFEKAFHPISHIQAMCKYVCYPF